MKKIVFVLVLDSLMADFLVDFIAMKSIVSIKVYLSDLTKKFNEYNMTNKIKNDISLIVDNFFFDKITEYNKLSFSNIFLCSFNKKKNHNENIIYINDFSLKNIQIVIDKIKNK